MEDNAPNVQAKSGSAELSTSRTMQLAMICQMKSINQSINQPLTPSINQLINQSINHSLHQSINQSMINQINQVLAKNSVHFSIHTIIIPLYYHRFNITLQHTFNNYFLLTKALTRHSYITYSTYAAQEYLVPQPCTDRRSP